MNTMIQKINFGYVGSVENFIGDIYDQLALMDTENVTETDDVNITQTHEKVEYLHDIYFIFHYKKEIQIYKQLPIVHNDEIFTWKESQIRDEISNRLAKIEKYPFSFSCLARTETGDGQIVVRFKGKEIDIVRNIENADNNAFLNAINEWGEHIKTVTNNLTKLLNHDIKEGEIKS